MLGRWTVVSSECVILYYVGSQWESCLREECKLYTVKKVQILQINALSTVPD